MKTDTEKLATLADAVAFVIGGLRSGSVKANPIINMDQNAENYDMVSMEEYLTKKLNDCGYTVPSPKPKEEKPRRKRQQPA